MLSEQRLTRVLDLLDSPALSPRNPVHGGVYIYQDTELLDGWTYHMEACDDELDYLLTLDCVELATMGEADHAEYRYTTGNRNRWEQV